MVDDNSPGPPSSVITCALMAEMLTDLMEGDLPAETEAAAIDHLASCQACEMVLAETEAVRDLTRDHGRVGLEAEDRDRMLASLLAEITKVMDADDGAEGR